MKRLAVFLTAIVATGVMTTAWAEDAQPSPTREQAARNNQFALELYARLSGQPGNLFFSPFSISTALAMTYAGARDKTAEEMAATLHFPAAQTETHPLFTQLTDCLNAEKESKGFQLNIANALWGQKGYLWLPEFLEVTQKYYGAGLQEVDFKKSPEDARLTINAWVEKQTRDKIMDLIPPGVLTVDTHLILTNAIYFKGNWASAFDKKATRNEPFHLSGAKQATVTAPMMREMSNLCYLETPTFQAVELPYIGDQLAMVILLPTDVNGLPALEKSLTAENLEKWLSGLNQRTEVAVAMPKFKFTSGFSLKDQLEAMGLKTAFTSGKADFSGISGNKDFWIEAVIHKAFVDVNEEGTEAAAATAVTMGFAGGPPPQPKIFRADHPFIFLIRDNQSKSVIFMGRLLDPTK